MVLVANIARLSVAWQNWPGAPGVTQLYFDPTTSMQPQVDAVRAFFFSIQGLLPTGLTINVPASGDLLEATTGQISGTWSTATTPLTVTGAGTGNYAGNAGAVVHWLTTTVVDGRRLRGRTFIVPLVAIAYDTAGSLAATANTTLTNAAATLVTSSAGSMQVWHRPAKATPTKAAHAGSTAVVTSSRVPDLAVSLRSRRV